MRVDWSLASAAGALYSTVDDLLRWDRGLATDALLPESMRRRLQTPTSEGYNAGWFVDRDNGWLRMYHEGSNPGYAGFIYRYPEDGLLVVVLSNLETAPVRPIADALAALASGDAAVPR
jgi:CubicO group peptidase (beta-lactamase class C family)